MAIGLLPVDDAAAAPSQRACNDRNNNSYDKLLECVRLSRVRKHQAAFQEIADANGGNRFSGFLGYDASVDYVVDQLTRAGVRADHAGVRLPRVRGGRTVGARSRWRPSAVTYVEDVDFGVIAQSDPGDVTAAVTAVDLHLGLGNTSTSGCEAADWPASRPATSPCSSGARARSRSRPRTPPPPARSAS